MFKTFLYYFYTFKDYEITNDSLVNFNLFIYYDPISYKKTPRGKVGSNRE